MRDRSRIHPPAVAHPSDPGACRQLDRADVLGCDREGVGSWLAAAPVVEGRGHQSQGHPSAHGNTRPTKARGNTTAVWPSSLVEVGPPPDGGEASYGSGQEHRHQRLLRQSPREDRGRNASRRGQRKGVWWAGREKLKMIGRTDRTRGLTGTGTYVPMGGGHMSPQGVWTVVEGRSQVFIKMPNPILGGW